MPSDLKDVLQDAAAAPRRSFDVDAAVRRAKRLSSMRAVRMIAATTLLVVVAFGAGQALLDRSLIDRTAGTVPTESLRDRLPDELDGWVRPGLVLAYMSEDDAYHVFFEGVVGHSCPATAKPEACFSTAQHITWNREQVLGVTGSDDLRLPTLTDGIEVLWRGVPEDGSIGVRSPGACDRIERFEFYECVGGVPVFMPADDADDLTGAAREARKFGFGRLPAGDVRLCPEGEFDSRGMDPSDIRDRVELVVRAANSSEPGPAVLWHLMDPAFREVFGSRDALGAAMRRPSVPRVYRSWTIAHQVWGPSRQRLLDIEAFCGKEVAKATWMGSAFFPRFHGVSGAAVQMFFLARPDGPRLWFTY